MSFACPLCGEIFSSREKLNRHLREKHRDEVKLRVLEHPQNPSHAVRIRKQGKEAFED